MSAVHTQACCAVMLVLVVAWLAGADLLNRTPHGWWQVPVRFADELKDLPGPARLRLGV